MPHRSLIFLVAFTMLGLPMTAGADCMGPYPPSMVKAFNESCSTSPKMQPFCACIMDDVQKNIPLAEFIEIGNTGGGIAKDARFVKASQKCRPLLTGDVPATPAPVVVPNTTLAPTGTVPAGTPTATPSTTTVVKSPGVIFK